MKDLFPQMDFGVEPIWSLDVCDDRSGAAQSIASAIAIGAMFGLLCATGRLLSRETQHVATFFPADGVLTAFLLCHPRRSWWNFLLAAWVGDAISILLLGGFLGTSGFMAFCNVLEVLIAALLLRSAIDREKDLASPAMTVQFLLFAVGLAPAISELLASVYYHFVFGSQIWQILSRSFPAHALGMAVMIPVALAGGNPKLKTLFSRTRWFRTTGVLLLILAVSIAIFEQDRYSLRFLWLPLLMLVVFEVGILGAILATFEVLITGALFTLRGAGPFWMVPRATLQHSVLLLQAAVLVLLVSVVPFAAILERQRQLRTHLRMGIKRYQLLADNSRDIVVLVNLEGRRLYVSPAVQDVLGWSEEEWIGQNAADFMHREDLGPFQRLLKEMLRGEDRRTFRYRTRHKNGRYLWMEANIRALPQEDSGEPAAFVANVRDITERVESEKRLAEAHEQIQQQAERDSLTQLANRRCFDAALEKEWRRGRRTGNPVALLMVDIDHFKTVNDTYGHRAGDQCLQAVAEILRRSARRPSDLAARYGGEEFSILLPDTDIAAATVLADLLCMHIREHLFEAGTGRALTITVSVGVAAEVPDKNIRADRLVEAADHALYAAKQAGRNCVMPEYGSEMTAALLYPVQ